MSNSNDASNQKQLRTAEKDLKDLKREIATLGKALKGLQALKEEGVLKFTDGDQNTWLSLNMLRIAKGNDIEDYAESLKSQTGLRDFITLAGRYLHQVKEDHAYSQAKLIKLDPAQCAAIPKEQFREILTWRRLHATKSSTQESSSEYYANFEKKFSTLLPLCCNGRTAVAAGNDSKGTPIAEVIGLSQLLPKHTDRMSQEAYIAQAAAVKAKNDEKNSKKKQESKGRK